jgi:hypothetical protein
MATTTELYSWGVVGEVVDGDFASGNTYAPMLNVPFTGAQVKDMHASSDVLFVTLNDGTVWVASNNLTAPNGNTSTDSSVWQQVQTSAGVPLTNVKKVTGTKVGGYALLENGDLYAWGSGVELGNGVAGIANYAFATQMTAPPVAVTYIGAIYQDSDGEAASGLLALGADGKVYGIGENTSGRIITTATGNVETWTAIQADGGGDLTDVIYLATSHTSEEYAGAAVITAPIPTSNGFGIIKVWGISSLDGLTGPDTIYENPITPDSFTIGADNPAALSVGGHAVTYFNRVNGGSICFAGHVIDGSTGGLTSDGEDWECVIPSDIELCGTGQVIQANDDIVGVVAGVGGSDITSVLENDVLNGVTATTATVTVSQTSTTDAGVTVGTDGNVDVTSLVPAGTYTIVYEICEIGASPANCNSAVVTVFVGNDNDGDGVPDEADIDDDNDGILDTEEGEVVDCPSNDATIISVTTTLAITATPDTSTLYDGIIGGQQTFYFDNNQGYPGSNQEIFNVGCCTTGSFNPNFSSTRWNRFFYRNRRSVQN